jgi:hypothetical protein
MTETICLLDMTTPARAEKLRALLPPGFVLDPPVEPPKFTPGDPNRIPDPPIYDSNNQPLLPGDPRLPKPAPPPS